MADILHRTTKQLLLSVSTPRYPAVDWIRDPDLSAVAGIPSKYWKITGDVVAAMTEAEKDAEPGLLDAFKAGLGAEITAMMKVHIEADGYEYPATSGNIFDLSPEDQTNLLGFDLKAALLTYPYVIRARDGVTTYSITDEADAHNLVSAAFVAKETEMSIARAASAAVTDATTHVGAQTAADVYLVS